jgi:hypothetical protein
MGTRILTIFGTRPDAIKMAPVVNQAKKQRCFRGNRLCDGTAPRVADQVHQRSNHKQMPWPEEVTESSRPRSLISTLGSPGRQAGTRRIGHAITASSAYRTKVHRPLRRGRAATMQDETW